MRKLPPMSRVRSVVSCLCISLSCIFGLELAAKDKLFELKTGSLPGTVMIGDPIPLYYQLQYNSSLHRLSLPQIPDSFQGFELLSKKVDTTESRELTHIKMSLSVAAYDSGTYYTPAFYFTLLSTTGDTVDMQRSTPSTIVVKSPIVDTSQPFKPIQPIVETEISWWQIWKHILLWIFVGLMLLAITIYSYQKFRKKKIIPQLTSIPVLTPYEKAIQDLQALQLKKLWQQGDVKMYYTELTDIIRVYLEHQFGIDCFEKTTSEIVQQFRKQRLLTPFRQEVRNILEPADLVKFAKWQPSEEVHEDVMLKTIDFIEKSNKRHADSLLNTTPKP